jgi:hypothetical protein
MYVAPAPRFTIFHHLVYLADAEYPDWKRQDHCHDG